MKRPVRIAGAALALAAVVAMQFAQPAQPTEASTKPDLAVAFIRFDAPIGSGIPTARFGIRNLGSDPSAALLVHRTCEYIDVSSVPAKHPEVAMGAPLVLPALPGGQSAPVSLDCPNNSKYGPPMVAHVRVAAQDEASTANNAAKALYPYVPENDD
jgi:hypothetical protein